MVAAAVLARVRPRREARESGWDRAFYRFAYRVGFTPWDAGVPAGRLVDLVEGPASLRPGRALDIGCGTGNNAIYLARRGWEVTGIDVVPRALAEARNKAKANAVSPRFVEGDVTRLGDLGIGDNFTLLVDIGCFHALPAEIRDAYVAEVTRVSAPGATLLMIGFPRGTVAPVPGGVDAAEIHARFPHWEVQEARRMDRGDLEHHLAGRRPVIRFAQMFRPWQFLLTRRP